jgi:hypothetical protein
MYMVCANIAITDGLRFWNVSKLIFLEFRFLSSGTPQIVYPHPSSDKNRHHRSDK